MSPVLLVIAGPNGAGKTTVIISRHEKSMANLAAVPAIADRVYIYDNSIDDVDARLCARMRDGQLRKVYGELPPWVADSIESYPRHPEFVDLRVA